MAVDKPTPKVGDTIRYTVTLRNNGPRTGTGITIADVLPASVTYQSSTPSVGSYTPGTGAWGVSSLANGGTATLALLATVNPGTAGTTFTNLAFVAAADSGDATLGNNRDSVAVTVQLADLAVTKTVNKATPNERDTLNYTVTVRNNGPDPATNLTLTDLLPAGLTYLSSATSQGPYVSGTGVWSVGGLASGATAT